MSDVWGCLSCPNLLIDQLVAWPKAMLCKQLYPFLMLALADKWHRYVAIALFKCVQIFYTFLFSVSYYIRRNYQSVKVWYPHNRSSTPCVPWLSISFIWRSDPAMLTPSVTWIISPSFLFLRWLSFSLEQLQHCKTTSTDISNLIRAFTFAYKYHTTYTHTTHKHTPQYIYQPPFIICNLFFHVVQLSEFFIRKF